MLKTVQEGHTGTDGFRYSSTADLLLAEAEHFTERLPLEGYGAKMPFRACFENAFQLVQRYPELTYCEGYAASVIPTLHAWAVTEDDEVIDPTWEYEGPDVDYLGIRFDIRWLMRWTVDTGHWGVFGGEQPAILDLLRDGIPPEARP